MKKLLIISMVVLLLSSCMGSSSTPQKNTDSQPNDSELNPILDPGSKTGTKPDNGSINSRAYIAAWLAPYQENRGFESFSKNSNLFNEINPMWYNLNPRYFQEPGTPFTLKAKNRGEVTYMAQTNGVKLVPSIQNFGTYNFDTTVIRKIINDPALRTRHVNEITTLVLNEGYDGIDIDYEHLSFADRDAFTAFIAELGAALKKHQKLLSVAVYAKTSDAATWNGPGAQDWRKLAPHVNTLKIMVYDYHWLNYHPGPIAPIDWLRDVLSYAATIKEVHNKIIVGLPLYGLDWGGGMSAKEVMYQDVLTIQSQNGYHNLSRNDVDHSTDPICSPYQKNVELHFEYQSGGVIRTVYYQDSVSIKERLKVIKEFKAIVKGITFWRLGGEDPATWEEVESFKRD